MISVPISVVLLFLVPATIIATLHIHKWHRRRKGTRLPLSDKLLRPPGQNLRKQIEDLTLDTTSYIVVASTTPPLFYASYLSVGSRHAWAFWTIGGGIVIYSIYMMIKVINCRRDFRMGLLGEMAVAEELNRLMLDGYQVYHDFPAEKFNVDHIIVGPKGIFAVETKARSKKGKGKGEVEATYDGQRLVFPNWTTTEPLDQAKDRARWLSSWLSKAVGEDIRAEPILTIPGWFIKRQRADGIPVLNPKEIRQYVTSKDREVLSESMITRICHQIEEKCRTVDPMDIVPG